jgi:hypothetical protein
MELTIEPATEETHRELASWRYPRRYDFYAPAAHAASCGHLELPV